MCNRSIATKACGAWLEWRPACCWLLGAACAACGACGFAQEAGAVSTPSVTAATVEATAADQAAASQADERLILVLGEPGAAEFAGEFQEWGEAWIDLANANGWGLQVIRGPSLNEVLQSTAEDDSTTGAASREQLEQALLGIENRVRRVWLVLIGHGTYTNGIARFNMHGPDITPTELAGWIKGIEGELILINCASASAPFLPALSKENRIVVTATQSGSEFNYARFGKYLAEAIQNVDADLDHDDSISLLEGFLAASKKTNDFYVESSRLATEHALLDDNHDRIGTTHDFYRGVRAVKQAKDGSVDGGAAANRILFESPAAIRLTAEQTRRREELETELQQLRSRKPNLSIDSYYQQLEVILLEIARLYEVAETAKRIEN